MSLPCRAEDGPAPLWMAERALRDAFSGTVVDGHYRSGRTFSEEYRIDGALDYREPARRSSGRWSIQAGSFCTIYDTDPSGGCYRVRRIGSNCFEFYFVARSEEEARRDPRDPNWTARAWRRAEPATCGEEATT